MTAAEALTRRLGGDWCGSYGLVPGPGHSARDRSVKVLDGAAGVIVHSFAGEDWRAIRDEWTRAGLLDDGRDSNTTSSPAYGLKAGGRPLTSSRTCNDVTSSAVRDDVAQRTAAALAIWRAAQPIDGTVAAQYLAARGIVTDSVTTPPSLRFAPSLRYAPSGIDLPAMVAGVCGVDRRVVAVHRTYLCPSGRRKAQVSQPRLALGPITGCAVRLAPAGDTLALCEGVEDSLAFMQMTGHPAWALLGTAGFKNFHPPEGVGTIVLAPDADPAGDAIVTEAAGRFAGMGLRVQRLRPPDGMDWNDCLLNVEERSAIREHDGQQECEAADLAAFAEIIGGKLT